jgi:hypothetical protein
MAGGLHSAEGLGPISEMGIWVDPEGSVNPAEAVPFLDTFSGDLLCYLTTGGGAWLKSGQFEKVKNLEKEVARYFEALIKGSRI